jgi:hypothetical protein
MATSSQNPPKIVELRLIQAHNPPTQQDLALFQRNAQDCINSLIAYIKWLQAQTV